MRETVETETYFSNVSSLALTYSGEQLKGRESSTTSGYGVRVLENNRLGFAYCQEEKGLARAVNDAKTNSKFSAKFPKKTPFSFAPKTNFSKNLSALEFANSNTRTNSKFSQNNFFDKALDSPEPKYLNEFVEQAREGAESLGGKSRIILSTARSLTSIENTSGFFGKYKKTNFSAYIECMDGDGMGFSYVSLNKAPNDLTMDGIKAAQLAKNMKGAKKPEPARYNIVLEIEALDNLIEVLIPSFSGDWKRRGVTKIVEGKKTFSDDLTIFEDGLSQGTDARPFDDEGTPSAKKVLVEKGRVKNFFFDRETAALSGNLFGKGGQKPIAGSCGRSSFAAPPTIKHSNIVVSPGKYSDLGEIGNHLQIHSMHGAHTANVTTGDAGFEVSAGFLLTNKGAKRIPVRGFLLSCNVFDLFSSTIAIEKYQRIFGNLISPRIAFPNVQVVA
ncbi:TldD/PmbA family protein [Candidatus Micrarchaeota archaeon]|nr:TldD/PmbA family protein [Candidatus Micrarchaeota archaeon]